MHIVQTKQSINVQKDKKRVIILIHGQVGPLQVDRGGRITTTVRRSETGIPLLVMCKARPKALKPGLPSPRSLSRAEPWNGLGRAQGVAWVIRSLSRALEPGLYGSEEGCSRDEEFVASKVW